MATNLDPALVERILASPQQKHPSGSGVFKHFVDPASGRSFSAFAPSESTGEDNSLTGNAQPPAQQWTITEDLGGRDGAAYDESGKFVQNYRSQGPWQDMITAAAMVLGGYYGGSYLSGLGEAVPAAGGTTAGASASGGGWADWAAGEVAGASANPATAAQLDALAAGSGTAGMGSSSGLLGIDAASGTSNGLLAGGTGTGSTSAYTTAAADSQAANATLRLGANAGSVPASVNLGSLGSSVTGAGGSTFSLGNLFDGMTGRDWIGVLGKGLQYAESRRQQNVANERTDAQRAQNRQWQLDDRAHIEQRDEQLQRDKWARIGSSGGGLLGVSLRPTKG